MLPAATRARQVQAEAYSGRRQAICLCCDEALLPIALLLRGHPGAVHHHDQWLPNGVLRGGFALQGPVSNWQWAGKRPPFTGWADVRIVHFVGHEKPWSDPADKTPSRYRRSHAAFPGRHFPDFVLPPPSRPHPEARVAALVETLGQHALPLPAFRRHLRRFPGSGRAAP
jgi:hypothetical protein